MIKKFEQFCATYEYENSLCEGFQSNKLKELVKQYGKPTSGFETLYDIKDEYIIDVVTGQYELTKKQEEEYEKNTGKLIRTINLGSRTLVVLALSPEEKTALYRNKSKYINGSINIHKYNSYAEKRHEGNLWYNGGNKEWGNENDDIHRKHLKLKGDLRKKQIEEKMMKSAEVLKPYVDEIVKAIKDNFEYIYDYFEKCQDMADKCPNTWSDKIDDCFFEIELGGKIYTISPNYFSCDIYGIDDFIIYSGSYYDYSYVDYKKADVYCNNTFLGITKETYPDIFD